MVWMLSSDYFLSLFRILNLGHFLGANTIKVYVHWVPCARNSSNSFMPFYLFVFCCCFFFLNFTCVFVMVWRCACGLNIIFKLIFVSIFCILNLVIFQSWILLKCMDSGYLVCATPPAILCRSFWNFTSVFVMVWRYVCGLDIILRSFFSLLIVHIAKTIIRRGP